MEKWLGEWLFVCAGCSVGKRGKEWVQIDKERFGPKERSMQKNELCEVIVNYFTFKIILVHILHSV